MGRCTPACASCPAAALPQHGNIPQQAGEETHVPHKHKTLSAGVIALQGAIVRPSLFQANACSDSSQAPRALPLSAAHARGQPRHPHRKTRYSVGGMPDGGWRAPLQICLHGGRPPAPRKKGNSTTPRTDPPAAVSPKTFGDDKADKRIKPWARQWDKTGKQSFPQLEGPILPWIFENVQILEALAMETLCPGFVRDTCVTR